MSRSWGPFTHAGGGNATIESLNRNEVGFYPCEWGECQMEELELDEEVLLPMRVGGMLKTPIGEFVGNIRDKKNDTKTSKIKIKQNARKIIR